MHTLRPGIKVLSPQSFFSLRAWLTTGVLPAIFVLGIFMLGSLPAHATTIANTGDRHPVFTGIDVLQRDGFHQVAGQRLGLITNHTGINREGVSTALLLQQSENTRLVALFSPEHGLFGKLDTEQIDDTRDPESGSRFYTYISTMGEAMKAATRYGVKFVVLDRPNPINGITVAGPVLDDGKQSFVGFHRLPVRHGMTVGELAQMFKTELQLVLEREIVPIEGWQRPDYFDQTGLKWINPSPNMRNLNEAILYPGIGLLETTNLSVGRGTNTPFEWIGAPWLDGVRLAQVLNRLKLPGVQFEAVRTGLEIALQLRQLYPDRWEVEGFARLLGHQQVFEAVKNTSAIREIQSIYRADLDAFISRRQNYLIYP